MPATRTRKAAPRATFSDEVKDAIERSGLTPYAIGRAAGLDPGILSRFLSGRRGINSETLDRLAPVLGLHLAPTRGRGRPRKDATPAIPAPEDSAAPDALEVGPEADELAESEVTPPPEDATDGGYGESELERRFREGI